MIENMTEQDKKKGLFREKAVSKLVSPEQIDRLLVVMTPKGWIALITLFGLILAALIWAIVGQIPISVVGKGILLTEKGVFNVVSYEKGIVEKVAIHTGDTVDEKTVVAVVNGKEIHTFSKGKVLEVYIKEGDWVQQGSPLAWVEYPEEAGTSLVCYAFFNVAAGETIKPGMEAKIGLENLNIGTYGYLLGQVSNVSSFPVTERSMINRLRNPWIIELLKQGNQSVIRAEICLEKDDKTPSGYKFTTHVGPSAEDIRSGTIADVRIVTQTKAPISYLFPSFSESKKVKPSLRKI